MSLQFFSIVLPTFNRAHLIETAVKSVLNQTFSDWELIIVDDGSTDNTKQIIKKISDSDERIKYFYQENQERSVARNNGIEKAEGKYICFLDSDDYFLENRLELLNDFILKANFEQVYYTGLLIDKDNQLLERNEIPVFGLNQLNIILFATIHSQQICIPAKILKKYKFDSKFRVGEDLELWLRINKDFSFHYIDQFTVAVVEHDDRTINLSKNNVGLEQLITLKYIFKLHDESKISKQSRKTVLSNCLFNISKHYILNGKRFHSIIWILKSILVDFRNIQTKHRFYCIIKLSLFQNIPEYI